MEPATYNHFLFAVSLADSATYSCLLSESESNFLLRPLEKFMCPEWCGRSQTWDVKLNLQ